jgi:putative Mg2+ transporter-C (MgtC) family protein
VLTLIVLIVLKPVELMLVRLLGSDETVEDIRKDNEG